MTAGTRPQQGGVKAVPPQDRFWDKVDKRGPDECWQWLAAVNDDGYGIFGAVRPKTVKAHRFAYELVIGPIPEGMTLDHLCRNTRCVNPTHLDPVPQGENLRRGNGWSGRNARKTECVRGHPYTPENTMLHGAGRGCRQCKRDDDRAARLRRKPLPKKRATLRTWRCTGCQARVAGDRRRCDTCQTAKTTKRSNIGKRCDALWSQWVKREGHCFRCGATEGIQAAHIVGRAQRVVRWSVAPPNGIPLCHRCHRLFDSYKVDREDLIVAYIGILRYRELRTKALGVWDKTYPLAELTAALKAAKEKAA